MKRLNKIRNLNESYFKEFERVNMYFALIIWVNFEKIHVYTPKYFYLGWGENSDRE